jgi:murein tripeptide amidase MpaA
LTTSPSFERFLTHAELTSVVRAWESEHPTLLAVESIGQSHQGRDIWLLTVTDTESGAAAEKPALWVEANIHSIELTGSLAALHLVHHLLTGFGDDDRVSHALRTRTFYVVPRLNPDGAEAALGDPPRYVRSSVRDWPDPWPGPEPERRGLIQSDIDGDGRILSMRVPDPNGVWRADDEDPRLLLAREPDDDRPGDYYRLLPEGEVHDPDGLTIPMGTEPAGLDLNRNWPMEWAPEADQAGAGPFATSEPEVRSAVAAMSSRPNICGYIAYHTSGGVHLRPWSSYPDEKFPTQDLRVYRDVGKRLTGITGYRNVSVYHDFKYDLKQTESGASDDWAYDHLGVLAWTWELWSIQKAAGIEDDFHLIEWLNDHPTEDDRKLLAWSDSELPGEAFVDWYAFDHPALGAVELGGWNMIEAWANPPPHLREAEAAKVTEAALFHALLSPRLALREGRVDRAGEAGGAWRVRLVVENRGWLPTHVTERALERKVVRPVTAIISLPEGVGLAGGRDTIELGQLAGRALKRHTTSWYRDPTTDRVVAEWVVTGPEGAAVDIVVRHQRAGTVRAALELRPDGRVSP